MRIDLDLLVAGAGPAGLTLAWKAAERGLDVMVFDRKKNAGDIAYTTSGSFIDLKRWNLPDDVAHPITRIHFASAGAFIERSGRACVIRRRRLLSELESKCVEAGAAVRYGTTVKGVEVEDGRITRVRLSDDTTASAYVHADCSGLGGVFNRHLPVHEGRARHAVGFEYVVPLKTEPSMSEIHLGSRLLGGYGWLFPTGEDEAIVGCGTLRREMFPKIRGMLDDMLRMPRFAERVKPKPIEAHAGVFTTGKPLKRFSRGNLVIAGDVALQGNPVAGEGVRFVMDSAEMAAGAVAKAVEDEDLSLLEDYGKAWAGKYYGWFRTGHMIQKALARMTSDDRMLDRFVGMGGKASDETLMTLLKGEADAGFLLKKLPKLLYKPFTAGRKT